MSFEFLIAYNMCASAAVIFLNCLVCVSTGLLGPPQPVSSGSQVLPPYVQRLFPPRMWLHILPAAGVVGAVTGVTAFVGIQKRTAAS